jgi:hypothetical protein
LKSIQKRRFPAPAGTPHLSNKSVLVSKIWHNYYVCVLMSYIIFNKIYILKQERSINRGKQPSTQFFCTLILGTSNFSQPTSIIL